MADTKRAPAGAVKKARALIDEAERLKRLTAYHQALDVVMKAQEEFADDPELNEIAMRVPYGATPRARQPLSRVQEEWWYVMHAVSRRVSTSQSDRIETAELFIRRDEKPIEWAGECYEEVLERVLLEAGASSYDIVKPTGASSRSVGDKARTVRRRKVKLRKRYEHERAEYLRYLAKPLPENDGGQHYRYVERLRKSARDHLGEIDVKIAMLKA